MNRSDFLNAKMIGEHPREGARSPRINVISVKQPWASALFFGKSIENRTWSTNCLGPMCIHASLKDDGPGWAPCIKLLGETANKPAFLEALNRRGCILGVRNLIAVADPEVRTDLSDPWAAAGQYHWIFDDADKVLFRRPLRCKGMLKIWSVDAQVIAEVLADKGEAGIPPWLKDELPEPVNKQD